MKVIVTAGPTRQYIDSVRFITNASSGQMGCAIAAAAVAAGHEVTLILAEGISPPAGCEVVRFARVDDLATALAERFGGCDALVMAAAVGDFRPESISPTKLSRSGGPINIKLVPVADILAGVAKCKRPDQKVIAFAVQDGPDDRIEADARDKMLRKNADYVVVNTPEAIAAEDSRACILSPDGVALPWADRAKRQLAEEIMNLL